MRRYSEPVQVRLAASRAVAAASVAVVDQSTESPETSEALPDAFIWHGRLYVVRQVLAHWRERRAWWREALDPVPGQPTGIDVASREHRVWRVEASPGRAAATGVFDLVHDEVSHPGESDWRLVRVAD